LLEHEPAGAVLETPQPRQERPGRAGGFFKTFFQGENIKKSKKVRNINVLKEIT
jgi:hypothetical protein